MCYSSSNVIHKLICKIFNDIYIPIDKNVLTILYILYNNFIDEYNVNNLLATH